MSEDDLILSPVIFAIKNMNTKTKFIMQKHQIVPTIISLVTGMSLAPAKILSNELIPPNNMKDSAVKIETREIIYSKRAWNLK